MFFSMWRRHREFSLRGNHRGQDIDHPVRPRMQEDFGESEKGDGTAMTRGDIRNWSGLRKRQNISMVMSTRSLAARLKRLEFQSQPGFQPPQIELCAVDSKAQTLYIMRLGSPGTNISRLTANP
jgi:hypothetical protein